MSINRNFSFPADEAMLTPAWPPLDRSVLVGGCRPAQPFPIQVFGPFWSTWIADQAERKSAPPDYVAGALLGAAAGLVGNSRRACYGWSEVTVLWIALVGNPSSGKSPATDGPLELVRALETEMAETFPERQRQYETELEAAKVRRGIWQDEVKTAVKQNLCEPQLPADAVNPEEPRRPRLCVVDATPEKMGELLAQNLKGLLYCRDELTGWLLNFDRYGRGGGERAFWLEAFGGRPYAIDRVKHGSDPLWIPHLSVSVLGGIQPDRLSSVLLTGDDDGLAARFLFIWPEPVGCRRPERCATDGPALDALRRLRLVPMPTDELGRIRPVMVRLTDEAAARFQHWREKHVSGEAALAGRILGHYGKMPGVLLRLALILQFLWWCAEPDSPEPDSIGRAAINAAAALVDDYFKPMAERAFGDAALPDDERGAMTIGRWLRAQTDRPCRINARALQRRKLPGLRQAHQVSAALKVLEDAGISRFTPTRDGDTAGRHRADYDINPALWENSTL
jgi:Protein of unknown function (DUF3987)